MDEKKIALLRKALNFYYLAMEQIVDEPSDDRLWNIGYLADDLSKALGVKVDIFDLDDLKHYDSE